MKGKLAWIIGGGLFVLGVVLLFLSSPGDTPEKLKSANSELRNLIGRIPAETTISEAKRPRDERREAIEKLRKSLRVPVASDLILDEFKPDSSNFKNVVWMTRAKPRFEKWLAGEGDEPGLERLAPRFIRHEYRTGVTRKDLLPPEHPAPLKDFDELVNSDAAYTNVQDEERLGRMALGCIVTVMQTVEKAAQSVRDYQTLEFRDFRFKDTFKELKDSRYGDADPYIRHQFDVEMIVDAALANELIRAFGNGSTVGLKLRLAAVGFGPHKVPASVPFKVPDLKWLGEHGIDSRPDDPDDHESFKRWEGKEWSGIRKDLNERDDLRLPIPLTLTMRLQLLEINTTSPVLQREEEATP